jgi:hypothetical protein
MVGVITNRFYTAELIENLTRIIIEFFKVGANEGLLDSQIEQQIVQSRN